jgi:hypothetical protein
MPSRFLALSLLLFACGEDNIANPPDDFDPPEKVNAQNTPKAVEWGVLFTSEKGGFSIRFPGQPSSDSAPLSKLPDGRQLTLEITQHEMANGDFFAVALTELPEIDPARIPKALDSGVSGAIKNMPGVVLDSVKTTQFNGTEGREFSFHGSANGMQVKGEQHIFAFPGRMLQFTVIGVGNRFPTQNAERFFGSLKID